MRIDTPAGSILCDPWVNPAYFASWFPFPDNSQLDWESLGQVDYLYVSHLHRDHFDAAHLRRYVSKQATVLLPEYPTSELRDQLEAVGFTRFLATKTNEVYELDGTWRYIDDLRASHVFPIAGPPCFLDDELWQFNDLGHDEGNIFPDQSVFLAEYAKVGGTNAVVLLPGSVAQLTADGCTTTHP